MSKGRHRIEQCIGCPNRSELSKVVGVFVGKNEIARDCEGPVTVVRGVLHSLAFPVRERDQASHDENVMYFNQAYWKSQVVCGKETIAPGPDEELYAPGEVIQTNAEGERIAIFISGTKHEIDNLRLSQRLLHSLFGDDHYPDANQS